LVFDESQPTFLKDGGMLASVLVANEVEEELVRYRRSDLCMKVDYEKTYNSIWWDLFLFDMLQRLGLHSKWIRGCIEFASISVLVNGGLIGEFKPTRGLRQRDPLTLFLFIVVAEDLARLVRQALKANMLKDVKVGRHEVESCMLVDDTLFLCEATFYNVLTMKSILRCYELALG